MFSDHRDGLCVIDSRAIPASFAAWKMFPSTSMLTALVHSSSRAYRGLEERENTQIEYVIHSIIYNIICTAVVEVPVVEHASHPHPLLLSSRQNVLPVTDGLPA